MKAWTIVYNDMHTLLLSVGSPETGGETLVAGTDDNGSPAILNKDVVVPRAAWAAFNAALQSLPPERV